MTKVPLQFHYFTLYNVESHSYTNWPTKKQPVESNLLISPYLPPYKHPSFSFVQKMFEMQETPILHHLPNDVVRKILGNLRVKLPSVTCVTQLSLFFYFLNYGRLSK